jgi:hypothetical protein
MKFSMNLSRLLKSYFLDEILEEYLLKQVNLWIESGLWNKWRITMSSGFLVPRKMLPFYHAIYAT